MLLADIMGVDVVREKAGACAIERHRNVLCRIVVQYHL